MSSNGHVVAATWRAEDFADLETLNGIVAVDIFEGKKPPVQIDARGYETLAYMGTAGNPLAADAVAAFYDARRRAEVAETLDVDRDIAQVSIDAWTLQDKALAGIHVNPPYCPKEKLVDGRPPPGHLWWGSYTGDQRRLLADFFYNGAEALKPFRARQRANEHALRAERGVSPAPEQHPDPERPAVSEVVAGRGSADLAQRAGDAREGAPEPLFGIREA